jgi:hypothetical protein
MYLLSFFLFLLFFTYSINKQTMVIKPWRNNPSSSSSSLFFGLFKLAMNESRLKTNSSFASAVTIPNEINRKSTPSIYTEKSATITESDSRFKSILRSVKSTSWSLFVKYWFLLGLLIAIILAIFFPNVARKGGYIRAEWSIKWGKINHVFCLFHH